MHTDKVDKRITFNNQLLKVDDGLKKIEKIRDWIIDKKILKL